MKTLKMLAYEQDVFDAITEEMVATAETVDDVITALDEKLPEGIPYLAIETVATECFNDYLMEKAI
jgi:hypothetical protein